MILPYQLRTSGNAIDFRHTQRPDPPSPQKPELYLDQVGHLAISATQKKLFDTLIFGYNNDICSALAFPAHWNERLPCERVSLKNLYLQSNPSGRMRDQLAGNASKIGSVARGRFMARSCAVVRRERRHLAYHQSSPLISLLSGRCRCRCPYYLQAASSGKRGLQWQCIKLRGFRYHSTAQPVVVATGVGVCEAPVGRTAESKFLRR